MRRFLPFAALLGVALVLGCQDVGTGLVEPDGLVPQFAKGGKKGKPGGDGDATPMKFEFTAGDLTSPPAASTLTTSAPVNLGKDLLFFNGFDIDPLTPRDQDSDPPVQMVSASFRATLDNKTGDIVSVKVWLSNGEGTGMKSGQLPVPPVAPDPGGVIVQVDLADVPLTSGKGPEGKITRGVISVGHLVLTPAP